MREASWDEWLDVLDDVLESDGNTSGTACPRCGAARLRIAYVGDVDEWIASTSFWCESCLTGISLSTGRPPAGAEIIPGDRPHAELLALVPDFHIIWPA
ncbi:hypothetical protein [Nocardia sp. NPDC052566]|uniref:hypothetical protein n=1 Tax=Nocardia sp. NPDC052566 TaxID=3364330 RepID=UPI0037C99DBB